MSINLLDATMTTVLHEGLQLESCNDKSCQVCTTPCGSGTTTHDDGEYVGIFDMFKIGVGPSSSHTMGPMWAGKKFVEQLTQNNLLDLVSRVEAHLYGSLALTGRGHATDKATVLGLVGYQPDTIDPDAADSTFDSIVANCSLRLNGITDIDFDFQRDVVFHMDTELPLHPNGMTLRVLDKSAPASKVLKEETYYSIGGGFIKTEKEMLGGKMPAGKDNSPKASQLVGSLERFDPTTKADVVCVSTEPSSPSVASSVSTVTPLDYELGGVPFPFSSAEELLKLSRDHNITIAEIMFRNECAHRDMTQEEVFTKLDLIASVFDGCVDRGLRVEGKLPVSNIPRRAAQIRNRLSKSMEKSFNDPLSISDWIAVYARAVNEENACGGRVVTAPTNGAAGTLPAVLTYYRRCIPSASPQGIREFLATAAAVGSLCKRNASISGAEAGCQAEIGSACAMAAAGLAAVLGGSIKQIENAAEIGLEHCLGMSCDPIMGLVQIPCIERNCVAAIKAVMACRLSLLGDGNHEVSLDSCIETMYRTGLDMQAKYRETSTGGLAIYAKKMEF